MESRISDLKPGPFLLGVPAGPPVPCSPFPGYDYGVHRAMLTLALGLMLLLCGCADCLSGQIELDRLVRADGFKPRPRSTFPSPATPVARVRHHVDSRYDNDPHVRSQLAYYFLRYDHALLKRGLLTADAQPGTLIRILWDMESRRNPSLRESPGTSEMRGWIKANESWFSLTTEGRSQLAENEREFARLQAFWEHTKTDRP